MSRFKKAMLVLVLMGGVSYANPYNFLMGEVTTTQLERLVVGCGHTIGSCQP